MAKNPRITVLHQSQPGKSFELDKSVLSLGRKQECDICIPDATISSHHCDMIRNEDDSYTIKDAGSTNGTFINNVRIKEQKLNNSDLVRMGDVVLIYNDADSQPAITSLNGGRTHTINLETVGKTMALDSNVTNFNPFASEELRKQAQAQKLMIVLIVLAILAVIVMVGLFLYYTQSGK